MSKTFYGSRLSEHLSTTPEGFLVAHGAVLCRTATHVPQQYTGSELGLPTDDLVDVYRSPQEVLSPKFLASLNGKPITDGHPPAFLTSENASWYQRGHTQNARPGPTLPDGERSVIADLVLTDSGLISKVKAGVRQLSVGYVYDVDERSDGTFWQMNLAANHCAVVVQGRAGEHVRIMDAAPQEDFADMCARFHRTDIKAVAAERHSKQRRAADGAGDPMTWDEAAAEVNQRMCPREENMEKAIDTDEDPTVLGDWAEDDDPSGALAELRKMRPFIAKSGNRQAIDSYNAAVKAIKSQRGNPVTDSAPSRVTVSAADARGERARTFEEMVGRYHRRYFHLRSDREERPSEDRPRVAQDAEESYEDTIARHRKRLLEKKY